MPTIDRATALAVAIAGIALSACIADDTDHLPLACDRPSADDLTSTIDDAAAWLERSQQADGSYWYEYDRVADTFSPDYNNVRHAGVTMSLYQAAAELAPDASVLATADAGLDFIVDGSVLVDDRAAFVGGDRGAELGSTALATAGLVHRRIATGDERYDEVLRAYGRFMLSLVRDDGGMWARAFGNDLEPAVGQTSTFYTGEAFWAFGLLANQFVDEPEWADAARSVGTYIATERDTEEEVENPPLADQWAAYGFAEMSDWGDLALPERTYVASLIGAYHARLEREIEREAERVGDGTEPPDESVTQSRGAAFGTTVEALGSLWRLASTDPGLADEEPQLRADLICGAAISTARQYSADRSAEWPRPEVVEDAWFDENTTRMDDQQHAMSGVLLAIDALEG